MSRFHIIKDTREKEGHGWWFEEDQYCSGTTKAKVHIGDYTIEDMEHLLCIERKESVSELAGNCSEKRFWTQMDRMATFPHKFLILEFSWLDIERYPDGVIFSHDEELDEDGLTKDDRIRSKIRIKGKYMMSLLSTMMVDKKIHVIAAGDSERAQRMAFRIMRSVWDYYNEN